MSELPPTTSPLTPQPTTAKSWRALVATPLLVTAVVAGVSIFASLPEVHAPLSRAQLAREITTFFNNDVAASAQPFSVTYRVTGSSLIFHFTGTDEVSYAPDSTLSPAPAQMFAGPHNGTYGYLITTTGGTRAQWILKDAGVESCLAFPGKVPTCGQTPMFPNLKPDFAQAIALIPSSTVLRDVHDVVRVKPPAQFVTRHSEVFGVLNCLRVAESGTTTEWCENGQHFITDVAVWGAHHFHSAAYATSFSSSPDPAVLQPIGKINSATLPTPLASGPNS